MKITAVYSRSLTKPYNHTHTYTHTHIHTHIHTHTHTHKHTEQNKEFFNVPRISNTFMHQGA